MAAVTRVYGGFRGVDFRGEEIHLTRSPDSVNMWRDYKQTDSVRTRPGLRLHTAFDEPVSGIWFYGDGMIVHSGDRLFLVKDGVKTLLSSGVNRGAGCGFVYQNVWYFLDGVRYLCYDGGKLSKVEGYVPTTSIGRAPGGGGTNYEDVNLLSDYRINTFLADGESVDFYLNSQDIDTDFRPVVTVEGEAVTVLSVEHRSLLH